MLFPINRMLGATQMSRVESRCTTLLDFRSFTSVVFRDELTDEPGYQIYWKDHFTTFTAARPVTRKTSQHNVAMMNAPAQQSALGCLHSLPARLTAPSKHAQQQKRCRGKTLQARAVAEVETQTPASTNGSTSKVSILSMSLNMLPEVTGIGELEQACFCMQAGVPQGTPVVETLVRQSSLMQLVHRTASNAGVLQDVLGLTLPTGAELALTTKAK